MSAHCWARLLIFSSLLSMSSTASVEPQARVRSVKDIEYARVGDLSLRMDASLPEGATKAPAVIIVHGGGWVSGDKRWNVQPLFEPLSEAGFAWFSISYRLATNVMQFGAAIDDVEAAIQFIKEHAAEYRVDRERMALIGESAGGQLAAMAALRADGKASVRAVVALYAPSDLVSLAKSSDYVPRSIRESVQGTPWEGLVLAGLGQLSPINNIRAGMPPFLFIHGTADALVPISQSREMCARMKAAGASCEVYAVEGGGHGIRWWESYPRMATAYKKKMIDWLKTELEGSAVRS